MSFVRRAGIAYGRWNRQRKLHTLLKLGDRVGASNILIVGVAATSEGINNAIEQQLANSFEDVAGVGLSVDGPTWLNYVQASGLDLPFDTDAFDIVFSNAVIEHVGDACAQQRFIAEHDRVGRSWMLTTPNRAFPVEAHDHTLFTHWARTWEGRSGTVTRLLTPRQLSHLLPEGTSVLGSWLSPTLTAYRERG